MSVKQLEAAVEKLNEQELAEFREWFQQFAGLSAETEKEEVSSAIQDELGARLDALDADPSLGAPWDGTMDTVKRIREKLLAQDASNRRV